MKQLTVLTIIIASVFMLAPVFGQVYPDGMVSYWKFDEYSGTIATDSVGTNDGTLVNGPVWTYGQVDGALSFDGVDDYINIPDADELTLSNGFTIQAWVKGDGTKGEVIRKAEYSGGWGESEFFIDIGDARWGTYCWISDASAGNEAIVRGVRDTLFTWSDGWHLLTVMWNGGTSETDINIYADGVQIDDASEASGGFINMDNGDLPLQIGHSRYDDTYWFNGTIDEVAIFNRALTPDEIQQHYQNGLNGLGYEEYITVDIDIKPGSYPNAIKLTSHGLTPVAIFSEVGFNATSVNPNTVNLAGALVARRGKACEKFMAHEEDVNEDGIPDLVVQVVTADINPGLLEEENGVIYAPLTGTTFGGENIKGWDEITIVPPEP